MRGISPRLPISLPIQSSEGVLFGEPSPPAVERALTELEAAAQTLGDNPEATLWRGVVFARAGPYDEAKREFRLAAREDAGWLDLLERLPATGLLPGEPGFVASVIPWHAGASRRTSCHPCA